MTPAGSANPSTAGLQLGPQDDVLHDDSERCYRVALSAKSSELVSKVELGAGLVAGLERHLDAAVDHELAERVAADVHAARQPFGERFGNSGLPAAMIPVTR